MDICRRSELDAERTQLLERLEKVHNVTVVEISTITEEGIVELRDKVRHLPLRLRGLSELRELLYRAP